jgi:hypothetical protein
MDAQSPGMKVAELESQNLKANAFNQVMYHCPALAFSERDTILPFLENAEGGYGKL